MIPRVEPAYVPEVLQIPQSQILSYVTNVSTPTHVRRVAALGIRILAVLYLVPAGMALWPVIERFKRLLEIARGGGWIFFVPGGPAAGAPGPGLTPVTPSLLITVIFHTLRVFPGTLFFIACMGAGAALLWLCASRIVRGQRWACQLALPFLFLAAITFFITALGIGCWSLLTGFAWFGGKTNPANLPYLVFLAPLIVLVLLTIDEWRFLRWIARQPMVDKPPVPFLPESLRQSPPNRPAL